MQGVRLVEIVANGARGGQKSGQVEGLRDKDPGGSNCPLSGAGKYVQKSWNLDLPESPHEWNEKL